MIPSRRLMRGRVVSDQSMVGNRPPADGRGWRGEPPGWGRRPYMFNEGGTHHVRLQTFSTGAARANGHPQLE